MGAIQGKCRNSRKENDSKTHLHYFIPMVELKFHIFSTLLGRKKWIMLIDQKIILHDKMITFYKEPVVFLLSISFLFFLIRFTPCVSLSIAERT